MTGTVLLGATAASVGLLHTLVGPDHYLPFTVLAKARGWGTGRTAWITALCGLGHVLSSVGLGFLGVWAGLEVARLTGVETLRGHVASWGLMIFGIVYAAWGLKRALRNRPHSHVHSHGDGEGHDHLHGHGGGHLHPHDVGSGFRTTPWVLFILFVFGPCEPLIPLVMTTYASSGLAASLWVSAVFSATTVLTMLTVVLLSLRGLSALSLGAAERFSHALAGGAIALCGVGMVFFGL